MAFERIAGALRNVGNQFLGRTGAPSPYLLPEEQDAALQQRRMAMAASLLQSAAPRPQGTGPGVFGALGGALQAGQQAQASSVEDAIRMRMLQAQMAQLSQGGEAPSDVRNAQAFGIPLTPEGFAQMHGNSAADQLALLNGKLSMEQRQAQMERDARADQQAQRDAEVKRTTQADTLQRSIDQTAKVAALTERLEGSFLEAGLPASSWRRVGAGALAGLGDVVGVDTKKIRSDLDAYDTLKKNLSDQLINLMSTGDLGSRTNNILQQYQDALANTETSPGAIMAIQANIAQTLLDAADANKIEIKGRDQIEANIEKWHAYATPPGNTVVDVPAIAQSVGDIAKMGYDRLRELDLSKLTQEQFDAVNRRVEALRGK